MTSGPPVEVVRKSWHMATGLLATPVVLYTSTPYEGGWLPLYGTIVALAAVFFVISIELLHLVFGLRVPFWTRQLMRVRRPEERFSWASITFLLTVIALVWLLPTPVALASSGLLAFGDGLSALVGRTIGRNPIPWNRRKTWEGSFAGVVGGFAGAFVLVQWYVVHYQTVYAGVAWMTVLAVGAVFAMFAESLPTLQDNVTVPTFAGISMFAVWSAFQLEPSLGPLFLLLP